MRSNDKTYYDVAPNTSKVKRRTSILFIQETSFFYSSEYFLARAFRIPFTNFRRLLSSKDKQQWLLRNCNKMYSWRKTNGDGKLFYMTSGPREVCFVSSFDPFTYMTTCPQQPYWIHSVLRTGTLNILLWVIHKQSRSNSFDLGFPVKDARIIRLFYFYYFD